MMSFKGMIFRIIGAERFVRIFGRPCTSKNCTEGEACAFGDPAECPYQNVRKVKAAKHCHYLKNDRCVSPFPCMREGKCTIGRDVDYCSDSFSDKCTVRCGSLNDGYCSSEKYCPGKQSSYIAEAIKEGFTVEE